MHVGILSNCLAALLTPCQCLLVSAERVQILTVVAEVEFQEMSLNIGRFLATSI